MQGMRIDKSSVAGLVENVDADLLKMNEKLLFLTQFGDDFASTLHHCAELDFKHGFEVQAILAELLTVADQAGGFRQHAGWHTAVVGTGSAELVPLNQCHFCAEFTRSQRG